MNLLLSGKKGAGKSSLLYALFHSGDCGGVVCLPVFEADIQIGKDAVDLATGKRHVFCRLRQNTTFEGITVGRYIVHPEGVAFAVAAVEAALEKPVTVVDEVGPLELAGGGLHAATHQALETSGTTVVAVRDTLEERVLSILPYTFTRLHMR
jgi:nucleoside-triphosphatase THEP1